MPKPPHTPWYQNISLKTYVLACVGILGILVLTLLFMGRVPWCTCGYVKLWQGVVASSENSQHIADWYSFSHIIHGFAFFWLFYLLGKKRAWPIGLLLLLAVSLEVSWEILENSAFIINRYREATISLDYYGDSVINSVGDVGFMILGFVLAYRLPLWVMLTLTLIIEVGLAYYIRDNLALNIIMLIYPFQAIRNWQVGS